MSDASWQALLARSAAREEHARRALAHVAGLALDSALLCRDKYHATAHLISRNPGKAGGWRASRFDHLGPVGHVECLTRGDAIENARANDADFLTAREVLPSNVDAAIEALGLVIGTEFTGGFDVFEVDGSSVKSGFEIETCGICERFDSDIEAIAFVRGALDMKRSGAWE